MPNRIVRDAVLDSDRYHQVDKPARLAFLELLLCADDYGLLPLSDVYLKRHTTAFEGTPKAAADAILGSLIDVDLLRVYEVEGARYAFIPRFGNAPRASKPKWPAPPDALGGNEIKHLAEKLRSRRIADAKQLRANVSETETETETETVEEITGLSAGRAQPQAEHLILTGDEHIKAGTIDCPHLDILRLWRELLPAMPQHLPGNWKGARAENLRVRWKEQAAEDKWRTKDDGLRFFAKLFRYIGASPFLSGRASTAPGKRSFQAELEWVVRFGNWAKIIEGKYHEEKV